MHELNKRSTYALHWCGRSSFNHSYTSVSIDEDAYLHGAFELLGLYKTVCRECKTEFII